MEELTEVKVWVLSVGYDNLSALHKEHAAKVLYKNNLSPTDIVDEFERDMKNKFDKQ